MSRDQSKQITKLRQELNSITQKFSTLEKHIKIKEENELEKLEQKFTCPITSKIFSEPIMTVDGQIYEKYAITKWFNYNSTSPLTGSKITRDLIVPFYFRSELYEFLRCNPSYKDKQLKILIPDQYSKFIINYGDNKFNEKINLSDIKESFFTPDNLINTKIMKFFIDIIIDLNKNTFRSEKFIFLISSDSTLEIFLYLLKKDINIYAESQSGLNIFWFACTNKFSDIALYLIKNYNISLSKLPRCKNYTPLNYCIQHRKWAIVSKLIELNIDIQTFDDYYIYENNLPIHFMCQYGNEEMIIKLVDKYIELGIDIHQKNSKNIKPIHILLVHQTFDFVKYFIDKTQTDITPLLESSQYIEIERICKDMRNQYDFPMLTNIMSKAFDFFLTKRMLF